MERLQRSGMAPNFYQNEINGRLNLQLNRGISYGRRNHDNYSNRSLATTEESTEVEDEDPEEEDDSFADKHSVSNSKKSNPKSRRPMVCGVCHLPAGVTGVAGVSTSPGPMLSCTQGHLLCQQCVHRYTLCSDVGCVVCGGDFHASASTCYRMTNCKTSCHQNPNLHQKLLSEEHRHGVQVIRNNTRPALIPVQQSSNQSKNWTQNYDNGSVFYDGNSRCTTGYSSGRDGDSGDAVQQIQTNENPLRIQQHHQQRSYCSIRGGDADYEPEGKQGITDNADQERAQNAALIHAECSRRPIRCPRLDCAVNVAFSALTQHFLFDHPEVPMLSVEPGVKSTLIVSFAALSCDSSRCLALLLVSGKLTALILNLFHIASGAAARLFNGTQIQPRYRNRLPLPVLAARLHCSNQNPYDDESLARGEGQDQGDVIIAWVAGLDVGNATSETLRCSIEAVDGNDNRELRSLTYTGPVNSLRTAQWPREVFRSGDCVILHQGLINHITSSCASLNVNVIVH